jgi:hypothetical protein
MGASDDYRRFLSEWHTADSANLDLDVNDPGWHAWLRQIAEPWWASIRALAHSDGFVIDTFEGRPSDKALMHRLHTPCARLVMPDGTPYHHALRNTQLQEAAYRDYGERVVVAARERHRRRIAAPVGQVEREPYASPLFAWPERMPAAGRPRWRRLRA